MSHHLLWGKQPHYKLHRRLDGLYSQSGHYEQEENPCPCQEFNQLTQTSSLEPSHYTDYTTPAPEVYLICLVLQWALLHKYHVQIHKYNNMYFYKQHFSTWHIRPYFLYFPKQNWSVTTESAYSPPTAFPQTTVLK